MRYIYMHVYSFLEFKRKLVVTSPVCGNSDDYLFFRHSFLMPVVCSPILNMNIVNFSSYYLNSQMHRQLTTDEAKFCTFSSFTTVIVTCQSVLTVSLSLMIGMFGEIILRAI